MSPARRYGSREVELTNLDKVFYPDAGFTKGDVVDYYDGVAEHLLPHARGRPLTLQRFPDGIGGEGFYQKAVPDHFPPWVERVEVPLKEGGSQDQVTAGDRATLAYLAQQGTLTLHAWTSRAPEVLRPDRMVFDLDPGESEGFEAVRRGAAELRELLEEVGLTPFVMLTGSKGAHLRVPLRRGPGFDRVRAFARQVADHLASRDPGRYTTEVRKEKRRGRLFLDVARNAHGQTAVVPYSLRALPGAPVAAPLDWDEVASVEGPRRWTLTSVRRRLAQRDDPWKGMGRRAAGLERAEERWERSFGGNEGEGHS